jgi:hypothetical protein|tara:strand:+ start:5000 stop:5923 length:924 start_codon:yes stop_codon:yes gene_type:complete
MAYITQYQYYENGGVDPTDANWGSYQYVSLEDIVNNFMLMYAGNHSLVNNEERFKILFHAKRAIQELNYDAFKEIKILELEVSDTLRFVLPSDYVNWVRVSQYRDGLMFPLSENIQTNWSQAYLQDNNYNILFDQYGAALKPEFSTLDTERIFGGAQSIYLNQGSVMNGREGWNVDGNWYFQYGIGARFGLNTETANINPTFKINPKGGVINFSSGMSGELCVLEYVSDGMENGDDSSVTVNKMFEEFIYAYIEYAVLGSKVGVQEYIVARVKKKKTALLRNAKIRISNIHPGRLLQNLRGRDKWIK